MCRWLAYSGPALSMHELLFKPCNSLISQSLHARQAVSATNGDGFGLGWYGSGSRPGLFRDTLPAWNDANLRELAEQIQSSCFFAHVRASTGTATSRDNCHPFRYGRTLFMHNGQIGNYQSVRRELDQMVPAPFYDRRLGTTDSEAFYLLALSLGLENDPANAIRRAIDVVMELMQKAGATEPFRMTAAFTDGTTTTAVRYSSDRKSPSLYFSCGAGITIEDCTVHMHPGKGAVLVLSEPLDEETAGWQQVPDGHVLVASAEQLDIKPLFS